MCLLLATHGEGDAALGIPCARFLNDVTAVLKYLGLTLDFVVDGILKCLEGVDVLHLRARAQLVRADGTQRDVDIRTEIPLLHAAVGDIDVLHDRLDLLHVGARFFRRGHIRLRDDFKQGDTRTVVIHVGRGGVLDRRAGVHEFPCVLLHMDAGQTNALLARLRVNIHPTVLRNRKVEL